MKIFDKIKQKYSYNLFALLGIFILIFRIFCWLKNDYTYDYAVIEHLLWPTCFLMIFIILLLEQVFKLAINNEKILNNKVINVLRYIGSAVALIYLILCLAFIFESVLF